MLHAILLAAVGAPAIFESPFQATHTDGRAISGQIGHTAPLLTDWNGDGKVDLLMGQFAGGRLWIYLNEGTAEKPSFGRGTPFMAGGRVASVSYG